jgi:hypothetical protein
MTAVTEQAAAWGRLQRALVRQEQDRIDAEKQASFARLQAWAEGRYRARLAAVPSAPTSGNGWVLLDDDPGPLEKLARALWALAWHGIPFPKLTVRWAQLAGAGAVGMFIQAQATQEAMILIDRDHFAGGASRRSLEEVILHELTHSQHPQGAHGAAFEKTLGSARTYLDLLEEAPAPLIRPSPPPIAPGSQKGSHAPELITGRPFAGRWGRDADGWERR